MAVGEEAVAVGDNRQSHDEECTTSASAAGGRVAPDERGQGARRARQRVYGRGSTRTSL